MELQQIIILCMMSSEDCISKVDLIMDTGKKENNYMIVWKSNLSDIEQMDFNIYCGML